MHTHSLDEWRHKHAFISGEQERGERRAYWVIALTVVTMVVEIGAGWLFNSMALLADGWHMASHAAALSITVFAYWYARRNLYNTRYTFGTGKVGVLGGFASAVVLGIVALMMVWESAERFLEPLSIRFDEAILVATVGLVVNLGSAWLLHQGGTHAHDDGHHHHHHRDHNLRAAFLHVLADALTSVLAILALIAGKAYGWVWMDPMMGIVGAAIIARWTYGLMRDTGRILLDGDVDEATKDDIRKIVEADADNRVTDLHVWRIGPRHFAAIISVVTHYPQSVAHYKALLRGRPDLVHVSVEVIQCGSEPCVPVSEEERA